MLGPCFLGAAELNAQNPESVCRRDRAEERRKGLNPDYERTAMSGLPTDEALNPTMSVEETKYLGGDLEHTHLVKGLDYALLQKVSTNLPYHYILIPCTYQ